MLATIIQRVGITPLFPRAHVSDDNPFIESFLKTYKYCPGYPGYFSSLEDARAWTLDFVHWYNYQHRHSAINFVTSEQKHDRGKI